MQLWSSSPPLWVSWPCWWDLPVRPTAARRATPWPGTPMEASCCPPAPRSSASGGAAQASTCSGRRWPSGACACCSHARSPLRPPASRQEPWRRGHGYRRRSGVVLACALRTAWCSRCCHACAWPSSDGQPACSRSRTRASSRSMRRTLCRAWSRPPSTPGWSRVLMAPSAAGMQPAGSARSAWTTRRTPCASRAGTPAPARSACCRSSAGRTAPARCAERS
mmetsp:Transcript_59344/g.133696  ORF Transcript_59344/g.133696 Transcript_59344/m.133696 type:complete len:222 (+) Transcript_59344:62-727(+)